MTFFNIILAILAIHLAFSGEYSKSAGLILVSVIVDCFDGYVARLLKSTSRFGSYLDLLSDFLAFGIGSAILMVKAFNVNIIIALFFVFASGFRLIYFIKNKNSKLFYGLPTTTAGGFIAAIILIDPWLPIGMDYLMILLSVLMLSFRIKYYRIDLSGRKTISTILTIFLALFVLDFKLAIQAIYLVFLFYMAFGWLKIKEVR